VKNSFVYRRVTTCQTRQTKEKCRATNYVKNLALNLVGNWSEIVCFSVFLLHSLSQYKKWQDGKPANNTNRRKLLMRSREVQARRGQQAHIKSQCSLSQCLQLGILPSRLQWGKYSEAMLNVVEREPSTRQQCVSQSISYCLAPQNEIISFRTSDVQTDAFPCQASQ